MNKETGIAVGVAVLFAVAFLFFGPQFMSIFMSPTSMENDSIPNASSMLQGNEEGSVAGAASGEEQNAPIVDNRFPMTNLPTQLTGTDTVVGTGAEAVAGKHIVVHYTGYLQDGTVFDSSVQRGTPFDFDLGAGMVIQGWEQGFAGMKVGGKRTLVIPGDMAYGPQGRPPVIPPNATLIFDVELLAVQ